MNKELLLGIDFGTGGCKVTLIDTAGNILDSRSGEYPSSHPQTGWGEQNPADWYAVMCPCGKKTRSRYIYLRF